MNKALVFTYLCNPWHVPSGVYSCAKTIACVAVFPKLPTHIFSFNIWCVQLKFLSKVKDVIKGINCVTSQSFVKLENSKFPKRHFKGLFAINECQKKSKVRWLSYGHSNVQLVYSSIAKRTLLSHSVSFSFNVNWASKEEGFYLSSRVVSCFGSHSLCVGPVTKLRQSKTTVNLQIKLCMRSLPYSSKTSLKILNTILHEFIVSLKNSIIWHDLSS